MKTHFLAMASIAFSQCIDPAAHDSQSLVLSGQQKKIQKQQHQQNMDYELLWLFIHSFAHPFAMLPLLIHTSAMAGRQAGSPDLFMLYTLTINWKIK